MSKFVFSWKIIFFFLLFTFISFGEMFRIFLLIDLFVNRKFLFAEIFEEKNNFYDRNSKWWWSKLLLLFLLLFTLMQKLRIVKTQNVCMQSNLYSDLFQRGTYVIHSDCIWLILIVRSDFTLGSISNKHITWLNANTNAARLNANYGTKKNLTEIHIINIGVCLCKCACAPKWREIFFVAHRKTACHAFFPFLAQFKHLCFVSI